MITKKEETNQPTKVASDSVNHPSHYTDGSIEVIDYIEDKQFGYHLGNAIKYISRAGKKDPEKTVEDLEKAIWYIQRYIKMYKDSHIPIVEFSDNRPVQEGHITVNDYLKGQHQKK